MRRIREVLRLRAELGPNLSAISAGAKLARSTVRNHVRELKRQLGLLRRETFVPQSYSWAQEAQVDWYEAWIDLGDERTKVQVHGPEVIATRGRL